MEVLAMTFKNEIKEADNKLLTFSSSVKEDIHSLREIKEINKQLKKVIETAEKDFKNTENIIKKARKDIKKTKCSKKEETNSAALVKLKAQEAELFAQYKAQTDGTFGDLSSTCQEVQNLITKLKIKEVI